MSLCDDKRCEAKNIALNKSFKLWIKLQKSRRGYAMSDEEPVGIKIGEKFFGLLTIFIGFIVFYFTFTSYSALSTVVTSLPKLVPGTFLCFGGFLMVIGLILILARQD
jgi:hypothetical protein